MNDMIRGLIRAICDGDISKAKQAAMIILKSNTVKKDEEFCKNLIRKMECEANLLQLPQDLKGILVAEDVSQYPEDKYVWRDTENEIANKVVSMYLVADRLQEKGIKYLPAAILWGESGCGKTELARYIAHKVNLPYVYVRFSNLVDSYLGKTQKNIASAFDYVKKEPCVVCFDEIDAIGMARGQKDDVGEMARIVISLMQELDSLPNRIIVIGTTNRFDMLDKALVRRFPMSHQIEKLSQSDAEYMARKFLRYAEINNYDIEMYASSIVGDVPASTVIKDCTEFIAKKIMEEKNFRKEILENGFEKEAE